MGLTFDPVAHVYELDGHRVPSVTGILKRAGLIDFSRIPPSILLEARDRGSAVHRAAEFYNDNDLDVDAFARDFPDYWPYLSAWITFRRDAGAVIQVSEYRVYSRLHQFAGTLDCLGTWRGKGCLLDLKTGSPKDVAADLQTAAYLGALREMVQAGEGPPVPAGPIVRYAIQLRKDATYRVETYTQARDYREFLALLTAQQIVAARTGTWIDMAEVA
jgi:PD-(D/E)XK nuclease superfamily